MFLVSSYSGLFLIHLSQVLIWEWRNEDAVGATPTGDAPTTSELSTILLPTKVRLILDVLRYIFYQCANFEITRPLGREFTGHMWINGDLRYHNANVLSLLWCCLVRYSMDITHYGWPMCPCIQTLQSPRTGVGVTKAPFVNFSAS